MAQDLRGDADVLEEPADGVLRLQKQDVAATDPSTELAVLHRPCRSQAQHLPAGRGGGRPGVADGLPHREPSDPVRL